MSALLIFFLMCGMSLLSMSCAPQSPSQLITNDKVVQTAELSKLIEKINASAQEFQNVRGRLLFGYQASPQTAIRNLDGSLIFQKPDSLLLKTFTEVTPHQFSLITKDDKFWFYFPSRSMIYTGKYAVLLDQDKFDIGFHPGDVLKSIYVAPIESEHVTMDSEDEYYVITVENQKGVTQRRLHISKRGLLVTREYYFNESGITELEILRNEYMQQGSVHFAQNISARRLPEDYRFYLTFYKALLNSDTIQSKDFQFNAPKETTLETITE